jgi:hypothetical protein
MRIAKVVGFGPPLAFVSPAVVEDANRRLGDDPATATLLRQAPTLPAMTITKQLPTESEDE